MEPPEASVDAGSPFWRWFPADPTDRAAMAVPWLNALYIDGVTPKIAANFGETVDAPELWDLFSHEMGHGLMGMTGTGLLLKNLRYALYLVLHDLDDSMVLHVGQRSWRLEGHAQLAPLVPRLSSLIVDLNAAAGIVDEAVCTLLTLMIRRRLVLTGQMSDAQFSEGKDAIRLRSHRRVREVCEAFERMPWFQVDSLASLGRVSALVTDVGRYALDPRPAALQRWWEQGRVTAPGSPDHPQNRLEVAMHWIEGAATVEEAAASLATVAPVVIALGLTRPSHEQLAESILEQLAESIFELIQDAPEPSLDVMDALGVDPEAFAFAHPVGRAIAYLEHGRVPRSEESSRWERAATAVLPIVTQEGGHYRCRYEVRWPGGVVEAIIKAESRDEQGEIWQTISHGKNIVHLGRMTLMPASPHVSLLWGLDRIVDDLLTDGRLRCLCGPGCRPASGCGCGTLLARVHGRARMAGGQRLPAIPCLAA